VTSTDHVGPRPLVLTHPPRLSAAALLEGKLPAVVPPPGPEPVRELAAGAGRALELAETASEELRPSLEEIGHALMRLSEVIGRDRDA
jgi:hypothetical protein